MTIETLYYSLPKIKDYPLNIYGYSQVLNLFSDVIRIIPSFQFCQEIDLVYLKYFKKIKYPCYFIPIFLDKIVYGFILKSYEKITVKYSNWINCFNLNALNNEQNIVFLVEGIKDSYILLKKNYPAISYLTSFPDRNLLIELIKRKKFIVLIPDNDLAGYNAITKFQKFMQKFKYNFYYIFKLENCKDFGDVFSKEKTNIVLYNFKNMLNILKNMGVI